MFEILFFVVFMAVIYKRIKSAKENGGINGRQTPPDMTVKPANVSGMFGQSAENPYERGTSYGGAVGSGQTAQPAGRQEVQPMGRQAARRQAPVKSAIEEAREDGNSTTAYLMEKAEADAREHAREKMEEQQRLHETRGGLAVAMRHLDGDAVPQGKRVVCCGYCGAENLVPVAQRTRYSCYFCREPL